MSPPSTSEAPTDVDTDLVAQVVDRYPVELAVLFGSHATGTATRGSDVDVAVAFDGDRSPRDRLELRTQLVVDLTEALGTDAVDVADLESMRPEVGASALRTGIVLVGEREAVDRSRRRFERVATADADSHDDRMRRFDSILENLEERIEA